MKANGTLQVVASKKEEKTYLSHCFYEGAFKITRPVYLEEHSPTLYLIHVGGGYVNGDMYQTSIELERNAQLLVTTQASTKVYRTPTKPVIQKTDIVLKEGSTLEYIQDPLIAYKDAAFIQETNVQLADETCLLYSDMITPGWAEDGSLFQYKEIRSKLKVYKNNKLVLFDHTLLQPDEYMSAYGQMEGYTHMGTFVLFHKSITEKFIDVVHEQIVNLHLIVRFGVSLLPGNGCFVRVLSYNTGAIQNVFAHIHAYARNVLLQKEEIEWRKY